MMDLKKCNKCNLIKPTSEFYIKRSAKDGLNYSCKSCSKIICKSNYDNFYSKGLKKDHSYETPRSETTEYLRDKAFRLLYDITLSDYNDLLKYQNYVCAICKNYETAEYTDPFDGSTKTKNLTVDHDAKTGKVRGLLCMNCNLLLGKAKDSTYLLDKVIGYLNYYNDDTLDEFNMMVIL